MSFNSNILLNKTVYLFWIFQLLFWGINLFVDIITNPFVTHCINCYLTNSSGYVYGMLLTLIIRKIYKTINIFDRSIVFIVSTGLIFALFSTLIWIVIFKLSQAIPFGYLVIKFEKTEHFWYYFYRMGFIFTSWIALYSIFKIHSDYLILKQNAEKAIALSKSARLQMLRYQLNPHFLFNSFSSIRALIKKKDNPTAIEMVSKISDFLKYTFLADENDKILFKKEINTIQNYFDIEKLRFGNNLKIEYDLESDTYNCMIPVFLLHPIIENAVKYGMRTSSIPLNIKISAYIKNKYLFITIINSGTWVENPEKENSTGTGLKNTMERIQLAYPENHSFSVNKNPEQVVINISIPVEN